MGGNGGIGTSVPEDTRKQADACYQRYRADNGSPKNCRNLQDWHWLKIAQESIKDRQRSVKEVGAG